jgi:hypothetical protein
MKSILYSLLTLALLGCGHSPDYPPESPYYAYPGGARLTLNQTIDIPPDSATLRMQYGGTVARNGVHEEDPYCIFELDTVKPEVQRILPDSLQVVGIQRRVQTFAGMPVWPYRFGFERRHSHRPGLQRVGFNDDDSPSQIYYLTEFRLHSEKQPQIRALTCMHNQMMPGVPIMRHLTLAEIRQALGGYFTLEAGS